MHLRILIPAILLAEIHEESLKDAVHPEIILREIQKLQSAILILAGKGRVPNQPADIKNQLIKPAKPMLTKPPQQTFCNTNLLNMRKKCHSSVQSRPPQKDGCPARNPHSCRIDETVPSRYSHPSQSRSADRLSFWPERFCPHQVLPLG